MTQKNETLPLILSLLITCGLIGGGLWLFRDRLFGGGSSNPAQTSSPQPGNTPLDSTALKARQSIGDRLLVPPAANANSQAQAQKQRGVEAIAAQNYPQAVTDLQAALQAQPNDPEGLIYLNNARIGAATAYTLAIAVPVDSNVDASLEMLRGIAQAQDETNSKGGISGVPLKVLVVNDGGTPEMARQTASALVDAGDVLGVVGHYASDASLAAGEVYNQSGLVMISPVSTSVKLSNLGRYTFRTVPSDFVAAGALANYLLKELQQQKAAVFFNSQSGYSQSIKSEFDRAMSLGGGQVVSEFDLSASTFSAAESFRQATQQGATVLALMPNSGQLDRALQVVQVNRQQLKMLAGDDVYAPKTLAVGGAAAQGMVVAVPWHILANPQSVFANSSRSLWRASVNWRTAMSYDATAALIAALSRNPTRQGVQQALADPNFSAEGATGTVKFLPSGDRNQSVQLVEIKPGSASGYGYDFVPIR
ncbi:MAG TPA: ABC transporter substrate-binding protein [Coleofasciculaceae cyanobacterium]|jgi:branched-chain amino acid transport system substrate-binding protein